MLGLVGNEGTGPVMDLLWQRAKTELYKSTDYLARQRAVMPARYLVCIVVWRVCIQRQQIHNWII